MAEAEGDKSRIVSPARGSRLDLLFRKLDICSLQAATRFLLPGVRIFLALKTYNHDAACESKSALNI